MMQNLESDSESVIEPAHSILEHYREVLRRSRESECQLRFGRRTVQVSAIAQQYYCEMALHLSMIRPKRPTAAMRSGTAGHEAVAALGVPMTQEESVIQAVIEREKPLCIYEFKIGWEQNGIPVLGHVDEAWFLNGRVQMVAERKFSSSLAVYDTYHVQAGLYCLGLEGMGFEAEDARYCVDVFSRACHDCDQLSMGSCPLQSGGVTSYSCERGACIRECYPFDHDRSGHELDWALAYWTYEREPIASPSRRKCTSCRWKEYCDFSTADS